MDSDSHSYDADSPVNSLKIFSFHDFVVSSFLLLDFCYYCYHFTILENMLENLFLKFVAVT